MADVPPLCSYHALRGRQKHCPPTCPHRLCFPPEEFVSFSILGEYYDFRRLENILLGQPAEHRMEIVRTLATELNHRQNDMVRGCAGVVQTLNQEINRLRGIVIQLNGHVPEHLRMDPNPPPGGAPAGGA